MSVIPEELRPLFSDDELSMIGYALRVFRNNRVELLTENTPLGLLRLVAKLIRLLEEAKVTA